ncbi:MAG TPA: cysteine rich repeat-containing protein [Candidatus Deferrimicrobiaceae bacterium]|nr:cysteine rich repeat-containing protein [Candidatus Deferrimicrobiaceae bacterium]
MRRYGIVFACLMALLFFAGTAVAEKPTAPAKKAMEQAGQEIVKTVAEGCKKEIETYCKDVTPGEGRVLACLYAHEDKLSGRCDYALYDAAAQLERAINALTYVANECGDDLDKFCANIEPGQGRLADCLKKNEAKVSGRCKQAFKDVGTSLK